MGISLTLQILTGLFLSFYYENNIIHTFDRINQIERNISIGWLIRRLHANGASLFFLFIYLHIGRNLYFKSFLLAPVWYSGIILLLILFITAFIGYVLPWGQIRYWGATVITNLLSSIPYSGNMLTSWLWGNFSVNKATLIRFFSFHFILPFILTITVFIHILFLHTKGSNTPLGNYPNLDKIPFNPFFIWKDLITLIFNFTLLFSISTISPYLLIDPDNFLPANPIITPPHIQPEWYFLFAYAILRTIPNKLGGVIALLSSILILTTLPSIYIFKKKFHNLENKIIFKIIFFFWTLNFIFLTLIGAIPIEPPFPILAITRRIIYFSFFSFFL